MKWYVIVSGQIMGEFDLCLNATLFANAYQQYYNVEVEIAAVKF